MMRYSYLLLLLLASSAMAVEQVADINGYKAGVDSAAPTVPLLELGANQDWGDMLVHNAALVATARAPFIVDTLADLEALASPYLIDGQTYRTRGHTTATDGGGMGWVYLDDGLAAAGGESSPLRIAGPGADDYFRALDEGRGFITTEALGYSDANSFISGWRFNVIDDVANAIVLGGSSGAPNGLGDTSVPAGTGFTPGGGAWATDSGYVTGAADYACILGGYDSRNNQLAGLVIGNHHFLKSNSGGHSSIVGGSYCLNSAARSAIYGGHNSAITGDSSDEFNAILGGSAIELATSIATACVAGHTINVTSSDYAATVGGQTHDITTSPRSVIIGGQEHDITTSTGAVVAGGYDIDITSGNYSFATGYEQDITAGYGLTSGRGHTVNKEYALVAGYNAETMGTYSLTLARARLSAGGLAQSSRIEAGIRKSVATVSNLSPTIQLDNTKVTAGLVRVMLAAVRDGSADGENDSTYTYACWDTTFSIFWDGTNYAIGSVGNAPAEAEETFSTAIWDGFADASTPLTAQPTLALSTGLLRIKVEGVADTDIEWHATVDFSQLTVD